MAVTFPGGGSVTVGSASQNALVTTPGATTANPVTLSTTAPAGLNINVTHGTAPLTLVDSEATAGGTPLKVPHADTVLMIQGRTASPNTNIEMVTHGGANILRGFASEG